jgi:hypothetical protein
VTDQEHAAPTGPAADQRPPRILVSGLRSTGKSSLVCALWGDSELLPTAVRDCTQTNTLVRAPAPGEADRRIVLRHLGRDEAMEFASRDLACHRLEEVVRETDGLLGTRLDELSPADRVRWATATVRRLFAERPAAGVLHEPATEHAERLEQFLAFVDSPDYRPGGAAEVPWAERHAHLMGRLRPDGRTLDAGRLLALRLVELVRRTERWGASPPELVDTPWIPTFHNARRADLILRECAAADALVIVALPEPFALEPWAEEAFRARPELVRRTVVVFNQVDTVDLPALFGRSGFAEAWRRNVETLARRGLDPENVLCAAARLPFLEGLPAPADPGVAAELGSRIKRLRAALGKIRHALEGRRPDTFTARLAAACDPADAGVESLRARLQTLAGEAQQTT